MCTHLLDHQVFDHVTARSNCGFFSKKKKKDISSAFISFYFVLFVCLRRMFAEVCACVRPRAVCACVHLMHILICQQCFFLCVCVLVL